MAGRSRTFRRGRRQGHRLSLSFGDTDPGINEPINDINSDDHKDEESAVEYRQTHDHSVVELLNGLDEVAPEPRDCKHAFDDKSPGGNRRDSGPEVSNYGQDGVSELVREEMR